MKRRGSSGGGGAAWDVEPERCRLARKIFLGAMVVMDDSKFEKKKWHTRRIGDDGAHKNEWREKNGYLRYLKRSEYESLCRGEGPVCCDEGLASQR